MRSKKIIRLPKVKLPPVLIALLTAAGILFVSALVIAYGRGYRVAEKGIKPTGILSANSEPVGAQVYIDGKLATGTNNSLNVDPGDRVVRISKDGYITWQKTITIEKEVVSRADAFMFPVNPSLSPITNSGIVKPLLSPDGTKIAYVVPPRDATDTNNPNVGIWIYEQADRPLSFNRDQRKVADLDAQVDVSTLVMKWSPDSTDLLVQTATQTRLYQTGRTNDFQIVTNTLDTLLTAWTEEEAQKQLQQLAAVKPAFVNIASSSAQIISFSPDETKILYEATASATIPPIINPPLIGTNSTPEERSISPGKLYVYDTKEDKNYFLLEEKEILPEPSPSPTIRIRNQVPSPTPIPSALEQVVNKQVFPIQWFPTSRHLVLTLPGKIDILEYDRTNWVTVYAGPFIGNFIAPWPGGSRLIILTNLNAGVSPLPNLYTVDLH